MSKSELHTILSSVQMSPVDRKRLVNYLNNFKNNQQQGTDKFIIKYNEDGTIDVNFDDLKVAVLNKSNIVIETIYDQYDCMVVYYDENIIQITTDLLLFLDGGNGINTKPNRIGFAVTRFFVTKNKTEIDERSQIFTVNGNGHKFLADDGSYRDIGIDIVYGLSGRLQSIENRIKALEDAANA